jgi:hypothetical protein
MKKIYCMYCGIKHTDFNWRLSPGAEGWYCSRWFRPRKRIDPLTSRSLRPDGSVATGLEGIRLRDRRLKAQEAVRA